MSSSTYSRDLVVKQKPTPEQIEKLEKGNTEIKTIHTLVSRKGNKIVYADMYEQFQSDLKKGTPSALRHFLKWLEAK